jgi:1,2-diacylglycerol-3-alpha-glucose alpha-1,2-glucosyltransferase
MKICLYLGNPELMKKSGIGRALKHQIKACELMGYEYCLDYHEDYDILHVNTYDLQSSFAIADAKRRNIKVIFHAHSTYEDFRNSFKGSNIIAPFFKLWIIHQYRKADFILTPTEYSKFLLESYNLNSNIEAISNGINLDNFKYDEAKIAEFKNHFKLKDEKIVVSVGLLFERKGLLDFIEVASKNPSVKFIWFGSLNKNLICSKVKKALKNAPSNVIFPGYVEGDIIQGAFLGCDCFFFPSYEETEGIVVLEALASKCNILVRNIGAYKGWLVNSYNCHMAESIDEFDSKLKLIINEKNNEIRNNAYKTAQSKSLMKISLQLKGVYDSLTYGKKHYLKNRILDSNIIMSKTIKNI